MRRNWLFCLFFLSGASALIYELLWERLLHLVLGTSTLAVSAVLAAFMGGLALGGFLFGRIADRTSRPLRLYAWLEASIGVTALLVPVLFDLITSLYVQAYAAFQPGPWGGTMLRLGTATIVLLLPATLIGGTLPLMARLALQHQSAAAPTFSLLYSVNTLGALLGAGLTGFVFLHFLGMQLTLFLAAALNGIVAVAAFLTSREEAPAPLSRADVKGAVPATSVWQRLAVACAAATGAITLGEEVVWTRILGILTSNGAYAFALMLAVMLLGIGLGSLVQRWWSRWPGDSWGRLTCVQWLLGGVSLGSLWFFRSPPEWLDKVSDGTSTSALFLAETALTASALLVPAFLTGLSFPLLVTGVVQDPKRFGCWLGRLYAVNTLGCVAGAVVVGIILIPWLGLQTTSVTLAAASLGVGTVAWNCARRPQPVFRGLVGAAALACAVAGWFFLPPGVYRKTSYGDASELLYYCEGDNGTVSVVQEESGRRWLLVDGQPVAGNGRTIVIDQKMLAHLPLLLHPKPERALTVGFGSGGTSHSMTLHGIQVDCVEIERAVPGAAMQFVSENDHVLSHPNFHLIVDDARSWLRVAPERYDVIATDCTNLQYKSNGDLYTVEYFRLMKDRLTPDGLAAAWVPANGIAEADLKTLLRSFREVFPYTSVWFMNTLATDFLIVIGTPESLSIDLNRLRERMAQPAIHDDLEAVGLSDPCRLLYTFLEADDEVLAYVGPGPLNTDDCPVLSYSAYGASFRSTIAENLVGLLSHRTDIRPHVQHSTPNMDRHYVASNEALLGHIAFQMGNERAALRHYAEGAKLLPGDRSLMELTVFTYSNLQSN
jgi:spermidine synthase